VPLVGAGVEFHFIVVPLVMYLAEDELQQSRNQIDIGKRSPAVPVTSPYVRVPYTAIR
jgi:hypothetical protein